MDHRTRPEDTPVNPFACLHVPQTRRRVRLELVGLLAAVALLGCDPSGGTSPAMTCTAGRTLACGCADGTTGTATCRVDGTIETCDCGDALPGDASSPAPEGPVDLVTAARNWSTCLGVDLVTAHWVLMPPEYTVAQLRCLSDATTCPEILACTDEEPVPECPVESACVGEGSVMVCSSFATGSVRRIIECPSPDETCLTNDDGRAVCGVGRCEDDEPACVDGDAWNCRHGVRQVDRCQQACTAEGFEAHCLGLTGSCATEVPYACDGDDLVVCRDGIPLAAYDCSGHDGEGRCTSNQLSVGCASEVCALNEHGCDGDVAVFCAAQTQAVARVDCSQVGARCVWDPEVGPRCVLTEP